VVIDDDASRLPDLLADLLADPTELLEEVQASGHDGGPLASARTPTIEVAQGVEHGPDGPALEAEFGSTKTKSGFEALLAADPTQHVRRGVAYPAVLLTAGFNDARVPPWQPAKLTAHLQHATTSGLPVLLRVDFEGGHTAGSRSSSDEEHADMLAFFRWQLGR